MTDLDMYLAQRQFDDEVTEDGKHMGTAMPPVGRAIPSDDLHALIELGYASKDPAVREAAGQVDTWKNYITFFIDHIRRTANSKQQTTNNKTANSKTMKGKKRSILI